MANSLNLNSGYKLIIFLGNLIMIAYIIYINLVTTIQFWWMMSMSPERWSLYVLNPNKFSPLPCWIFLAIFFSEVFFYYIVILMLPLGRVTRPLLPLLACAQAVVGLHEILWWCIDHSTPSHLDITITSTQSIIW